MSIRLKAILSFFLVTAAIAFGATGFSYWLLQDSLTEEIRGRLRNIAHIGAASIDTAATERLIVRLGEDLDPARIAGIERSTDYLRIDAQFQAIRDAEPKLIQYVYILTPTADPNTARFLVDADVRHLTAKSAGGEKVTEEISHFGLRYDIADKVYIREAFATGSLVVEKDFVPDPQYRTNSLSAYAPVRDASGKLLGILGVDLKDENMRAALRQSTRASTAIVFVAILAALVVSVLFGNQLTSGIRALDSVVREFAMKKFDVRAKVTSRDEIGHLGASFNTMAQTIDHHASHLQALLAAYGRFVPHSFLGFLQKESVIDLRLGDHVQKEMTVLFSDIRSFTTLSESMSPRENFDFINAFLRRVGPVIRDHGGVIDKYIGDAVMALFPGSTADAVRAGIDMQRKVAEYNRARAANGYQPIFIGVGLHAGSLILGTVGEAERMNSTVISDAVNLASRLEGVTKRYGASIVVSEAVLAGLSADCAFQIRFLDRIQVKGKTAPVAIHEVFDADPEPSRSLKAATLDDWRRGIDVYFARRFADALQRFRAIAERNPDDQPARMYAARAENALRDGVAQDWTGVEVLDSK
jgi:class 3 adenylate cyclase